MPSIGACMRRRMRTPPKKYQIQGVRFLHSKRGRALIGDDMGVGKTYQAIAWLKIRPKIRPVVIVCPASAKPVWESQFKQHAGIKVFTAEGRTPSRIKRNIIILNYDILQYWTDVLLDASPKAIILDECHRAKNMQAKRTKACMTLARHCKYVVCLSGTPINNNPIEFFPTLNMIAPEEFPNFWKFAFRYTRPTRGFRGIGWEFKMPRNLHELHNRVSAFMIRRMKEDVLPELPARVTTTIPVTITNRKEYMQVKENFIAWLRKTRGKAAAKRALFMQAHVKLSHLIRVVAEGKMDHITAWIDDWLEDTQQKLVVFGVHKAVMQTLYAKYRNISASITGETPRKLRKREVRRFQNNDKCRLFFGNIAAAGESITLTAASSVLFAELTWSPTQIQQAADRVRRLGQQASSVNVFYMIGKDTIEETVVKTLERKMKVVNTVLNGEHEANKSLVNSVLKELTRKV